MRAIGTTFVLLVLIASAFSAIAFQPFTDKEEIEVIYRFEKPVISNVGTEEKPLFSIDIPSLPKTNREGIPKLPVKPGRILLPKGKGIKKIEVEIPKKIFLGRFPAVERGGKVVPLTPSAQIKFTDDKKENPLIENVGVYVFRGYKILHLNVYPVHYDAKTGKTYFFPVVKIRVWLKPSSYKGGYRGLEKDREIVERIVDNPEILDTYGPVKDSKGRYQYLIITSEKFKNYDGEFSFHDLVEHKKSIGTNATIVTLEDILANDSFSVNGEWGDNNPDNPFYQSPLYGSKRIFNDVQARIRNFIRYAYMTWGVDYVLLAGDADAGNQEQNIVPVRYLFADESSLPLSSSYEAMDIPSDLYYACLDGNFNYDGDFHFGEAPKFNSIANVDEADLYAEVWVGRACVDSEEEIQNFVQKVIRYDNLFYDPYFKEILFLGETLGGLFYSKWGGDYKDVVEPYVPEVYHLTKLYDRDSPMHQWNMTYYFYRLNQDPPILINHDGHGSPTSAMRLNCEGILALTNEKYYFIYSHACLAGAFDNYWPPVHYKKDCVAEYFTVETPHGAIGVIMNSRYGLGSRNSIFSPSGALDESFFKALFIEKIREFGRANHFSKEDNIWRINENGIRWACYETNLLGDPQVALKNPMLNIKLEISITHPVNGSYLYINDKQFYVPFLKVPAIIGKLTIKAKLNLTPSFILEEVDFFIDDKLVYSTREGPYEAVWSNGSTGYHVIKVIAKTRYNFTASDQVKVFRVY